MPQAPPIILGCLCGGVAGFLWGLLPLFIGRYREQEILGWVGLACCTVGGVVLGLLLAVPLALLFTILIFAVSAIPMNWGSSSGRRRRRRPPKPRHDYRDEDEDPIARRIRRREDD